MGKKKERVTLPCGCNCGKNIPSRTPRQLERDLAKSLSGNLFFNQNHFGRWSYRNQKELQVEQEIQEMWNDMWEKSHMPHIIYKGKKVPSMGNLLDLMVIPEATPLGGHSAPTKSYFKVKGMADKNEQVKALEEKKNELQAQMAKLQAEIDGTPANPMTLTEATAQNLGNTRTFNGDSRAKLINEKFPENKIISRCYNPPIQITSDLVGRVWIGKPENLITDSTGNPVTELPLCQGDLGIWTVVGNDPIKRNPYNSDEENGEYVKLGINPESDFSDPHCYCCSDPIQDGVKDSRGFPMHWYPAKGTMTERQVAWRWFTFDGSEATPGPGKRSFSGTLDEYVAHIKATYPISGSASTPPAPTTPVQQALEEQNVIVEEADDNSDLPPGLR